MTNDKYTRLPAHVHEFVEAAGPESVYWSTARRLGDRPPVGGGAGRLHNAVVGSDLKATAPTPSEQPIWESRYYEIELDDYLEAPAELPAVGSTGFFVGSRQAGADSMMVLERQNSSSPFDPTYQIRSPSDAGVSLRVTDDDGNTFTSQATGLSLDSLFAVAWSHHTDGTLAIVADDGTARAEDSDTIANGFSSGLIDSERYFIRFNDNQPFAGRLRAISEAAVEYSLSDLHALVDSLVWHWRIE